MSDTLKEILTWMGILGIPTLFTMISYALKRISKIRKENREREKELNDKVDLLMKAHQAALRRQLLKDYRNYHAQGWIYQDDLDEWLNMYESYHNLGKNGVMDKRYEQMMELEVCVENGNG